MDIRRNELDQIIAQGRQLSSHCDSQTSLKINEITHRLQQQWSTVEQRLQDIVRPSRDIVDNWRQFNASYVHLLDRLSELEARWYSIQREKFTSDIETLFDKAKVKQHRFVFFSFLRFFLGFSSSSSTTRSRNRQTLRTSTKTRSISTTDLCQENRHTIFRYQKSTFRTTNIPRETSRRLQRTKTTRTNLSRLHQRTQSSHSSSSTRSSITTNHRRQRIVQCSTTSRSSRWTSIETRSHRTAEFQ